MSSRLGTSTDKIDALHDYAKSPLFSDAEKVALEYADAMTTADVDDDLFARLQGHYDDDTIAELTMIIAWENASSRFNRAFRIPSQEFWKRARSGDGGSDGAKQFETGEHCGVIAGDVSDQDMLETE